VPNPFAYIGHTARAFTQGTGNIALFFAKFLAQIPRVRFKLLFKQCDDIGVKSLPIVILTAFFTGGVLALQSYNGFDNTAIASTQVGKLVALSILRELGPVLAGLMVAGRVGAAMAAELGTMRVTEQIDALYTMGTNSFRYLVAPRILACFLMLPLLVIVANVVGILGGYAVATQVLGLNPEQYLNTSFSGITSTDLTLGLVKAAVFGLIIGLMGCYHGYHTKGGAEGVGRAATIAVVYASVCILVSDYFITAWFI